MNDEMAPFVDAGLAPPGDAGLADAGFGGDAGTLVEFDAGTPGLTEEFLFDGGWFAPHDGLFGGYAFSVARARTRPSTVYAEGFVSDDEGRHWRKMATQRSVHSLAVSDDDANEVWVSQGEEGVWRSTDSGAHFTKLSAGPKWGRSMAVSNAAAWVLNELGLWRSTDRGLSWQRHDLPAVPSMVVAVAVVASRDGVTAWVQFTTKVWKTTDGGATWVDVTPASVALNLNARIIELRQSPDDDHHLWVSISPIRWPGQTSPPLESLDGGGTWRELALPPSTTVFPAIGDADVIYAALEEWQQPSKVWVSVDRGVTFSLRTAPRLSATTGGHTRLVPRDRQSLLAFGGVAFELRRSLDGAASWARSVDGYALVRSSAAASSPMGLLAVGGEFNDVFLSRDLGRSWVRTQLDSRDGDEVVAITFCDEATLYVATNAGWLFVSHDAGASFARAPHPGGMGSPFSCVGGVLWSGRFFSRDEGQHWQGLTNFEPMALGVDASGQAAWFGTASNLLVRSDGTAVSTLPMPANTTTDMFVPGWSATRLFAVFSNRDLRAYDDLSWRALPSPQAFGSAYPAQLDVLGAGAQTGNDILVAAGHGALHRSSPGVTVWYSDPVPGDFNPTAVAVAQNGSVAVVTSHGVSGPVYVTRP